MPFHKQAEAFAITVVGLPVHTYRDVYKNYYYNPFLALPSQSSNHDLRIVYLHETGVTSVIRVLLEQQCSDRTTSRPLALFLKLVASMSFHTFKLVCSVSLYQAESLLFF